MTKNEIVARFMGYTSCTTEHDTFWNYPSEDCRIDNWRFHSNGLAFERSYDWLMPAWVKFRDLNHPYSDTDNYRKWDWYRTVIANTITHGTITEAFDELVKGIEWYEQLKNTSK